MKKSIHTALMFCLWMAHIALSYAQTNLVPNPDFEDTYTFPPGSRISFDSINADLKYWMPAPNCTTFTGGWFFHANSNTSIKRTPLNNIAYQAPNSGKAYVSLRYYFLEKESPLTYMFVQNKLREPLEKNAFYQISYYINVARPSYDSIFAPCYMSDIGLYVSDSLILRSSYQTFNDIIPQINNPVNEMLDDTLTWKKVSGLYKARGGEQYIAIGVFKTKGYLHTTCDTTKYLWFDFFLDDVSVIKVAAPAQPQLPKDTFLCVNDTLLLGSGLPGSPYLTWPDGSHDSTYRAIGPGTYIARYDSLNYHAADTMIIKEKKINLSLPIHDTTLCPGSSFTLQLPNLPGRSYTWPDGSMGNEYKIDKPGAIKVTAHEGNCTASDQLLVKYYDTTNRYRLPADTILCSRGNLIINTSGIDGIAMWQDGSTLGKYTISTEGEYTLTIQDACGQYSSSMRVKEEVCDCQLYIPRAFSPGTDRLNDIFIPQAECPMEQYRFCIYNRWGELVFEATDPTQGWDGKRNGQLCPVGAYLYTLKGLSLTNGSKSFFRNGTVTLIR